DRLDQIEIIEAAVEDEEAAVDGLHRSVIAALGAATATAAATVSIKEMHRAARTGCDQAVVRTALDVDIEVNLTAVVRLDGAGIHVAVGVELDRDRAAVSCD